MEKKLLSPMNDVVFKKLFVENRNALIGLLKCILNLPDEEYVGLEILNPILLPEHIGAKTCVLDIKLRTASGKIIYIELQVKPQDYIWKRFQFYSTRVLSDEGKRGGDYDKIPDIIGILISDFIVVNDDTRCCHCFSLYDKEADIEFKNSIKLYTVETKKIQKLDGSLLSAWMLYFRAEKKEEFDMLQQIDPAIAEACGAVRRLSEDESFRLVVEAREKAFRDLVSAEASALRKGKQEERQAVAANALRKKIPVETVAEITGLSVEEVNQIADGLADQRAGFCA
ncbi:MAG: Rpn family recombination-promoting nuclease/putative transposase [Desulfovibrio sp.]|jgi:predicted transposase/invertase (TIGR01784 family)|nr:Rpn family recombination-promoting nuclease/putative transposase [Desulfovibrio sp.]